MQVNFKDADFAFQSRALIATTSFYFFFVWFLTSDKNKMPDKLFQVTTTDTQNSHRIFS